MPTYEYSCNACGARVNVFVRSINSTVNAVCDRCGSADLKRLISKVAIIRAPLDPSTLNKNAMLDGVDYSNPQSMANFLKRMQDDFHDEPDERMDEVVKRLEYGESVQGALGLDDHTGHDHNAFPVDFSASDGGDGD